MRVLFSFFGGRRAVLMAIYTLSCSRALCTISDMEKGEEEE